MILVSSIEAIPWASADPAFRSGYTSMLISGDWFVNMIVAPILIKYLIVILLLRLACTGLILHQQTLSALYWKFYW